MSARLSDVEKMCLRDRALWSQSHTLFTTIEHILAVRLAEAEQAAEQRVMEAEAHAIECERIGVNAIEARILAEAKVERVLAAVQRVIDMADYRSTSSLSRTFDGRPPMAFVPADDLRALVAQQREARP